MRLRGVADSADGLVSYAHAGGAYGDRSEDPARARAADGLGGVTVRAEPLT